MIEQINIALEQKGSTSSSHWSLPSETNVRKESIYTKSDEEWTSRVLPSEQDDIVNSHLITRALAVIELQFYHFLTGQTACWLCHRLNSLHHRCLRDQSTTRNNLILSCFTNAASIALNASRDTLASWRLRNYNIRVTHRNGAIKHIFYTNQIHVEGSSADCSLFICRSMRLLFI